MGVHANSKNIGSGFFRRTGELSTDELFELADALHIEMREAPESDLHDWARQTIFDALERITEVARALGEID